MHVRKSGFVVALRVQRLDVRLRTMLRVWDGCMVVADIHSMRMSLSMPRTRTKMIMRCLILGMEDMGSRRSRVVLHARTATMSMRDAVSVIGAVYSASGSFLVVM